MSQEASQFSLDVVLWKYVDHLRQPADPTLEEEADTSQTAATPRAETSQTQNSC